MQESNDGEIVNPLKIYPNPVSSTDVVGTPFLSRKGLKPGNKNYNMQTQRFSLRRRAKSFHFAFDGLQQFFRTQHNAIVHAVVTVIVIVLSFVTKPSLTEILFITVSIAMVWMAELFNTAIEKICDMICPGRSSRIRFIKDISAAAVLVTAIMAIVVGCLIFIPKFL